MASFAFTDKDSERLEVDLYFNFRHQWFYQLDIKRCELNQPHVIEFFHCWQGALVNIFKINNTSITLQQKKSTILIYNI